jgi:hypothetical protein
MSPVGVDLSAYSDQVEEKANNSRARSRVLLITDTRCQGILIFDRPASTDSKLHILPQTLGSHRCDLVESGATSTLFAMSEIFPKRGRSPTQRAGTFPPRPERTSTLPFETSNLAVTGTIHRRCVWMTDSYDDAPLTRRPCVIAQTSRHIPSPSGGTDVCESHHATELSNRVDELAGYLEECDPLPTGVREGLEELVGSCDTDNAATLARPGSLLTANVAIIDQCLSSDSRGNSRQLTADLQRLKQRLEGIKLAVMAERSQERVLCFCPLWV